MRFCFVADSVVVVVVVDLSLECVTKDDFVVGVKARMCCAKAAKQTRDASDWETAVLILCCDIM